MALWFLRGLRRGVVTTRYPRAAEPSAALLPTPPAFDSARLSAAKAEAMIAVCPSRALWIEAGQLVLDLGRCTSCGHCIEVEPSVAGRSGHFELASRDRERLIRRFRLQEGADG